MHVVIVAFDLKDKDIEFAELRAWVRERAAADYSRLEGMRLKTWFSDERKRLWGAVYLVDSADAFDEDKIPRLPNGKTGPVGTRPTSVTWFDLEAFVPGPLGLDGLDDLRDAGLCTEGSTV